MSTSLLVRWGKALRALRWCPGQPAIIGVRAGAAAAVLVLVAGCSAVQFTYGLAPRLAYGWLDDYADFTPAQEPVVRAAVDRWFDWHRRTQLPDYADALATLRERASQEWTADAVCDQAQAWRQRALRAMDRGIASAAPLLRILSTEQIDHMEREQAQALQKWRDEQWPADPAKRLAAAVTSRQDQAERLYGSLSPEQLDWLKAAVAAAPLRGEAALAERRARQQRLIAQLRRWTGSATPVAQIEAALRADLADWLMPSDAARGAAQVARTQAGCQYMADLHARTTPAQRQHAAEQFASWAADLRALARP